MKAAQNFSPRTVGEVVAFLAEHPEATVFAGGTDLLVGMAHRKIQPEMIVDLKCIPELNYVRSEGQCLKIGAMATISAVEENTAVREGCPFLAAAASHLGSWQVRNTATVGGNLCNAAPSAEMATPLLALGSEVTLISAQGERTLPLSDFFAGPGQTVLKKGEILKEITVPAIPENGIGVYLRHQLRRSMDISIVNLTVLAVKEGNAVKEARVYLGAVAPVPLRAVETEKVLTGQTLSKEVIEKAGETAAGEARPITDVRASAWYRKRMVKVYAERALTFLAQSEVGKR